MAPLLGKRKRRDKLSESAHNSDSYEQEEKNKDLRDQIRRHFESAFEPLDSLDSGYRKDAGNETSDPDSQSDPEWDGCSDKDREIVQVIDHINLPSSKTEISRQELSAFMTAKPPSVKQTAPISRKDTRTTDEEANSDAADLKKDLALQRLLKESHLLESSSALSHVGQNRHKALDLRLQDMGSKSSIFKQQNMPLAQRKGITAKSVEREGLRRREAQENGIILEKASKSKSKEGGNRQRGIGAPNIGKFRGGMLKLSTKDVASIEGPKKSTRGRR